MRPFSQNARPHLDGRSVVSTVYHVTEQRRLFFIVSDI